MQIERIPLTRSIWNAALLAMSASGRWQEAVMLLESMRHSGHSPDELSYASAILSCGGKKLDVALRLLDEMKSEGLQPDLRHYRAAVGACAETGRAANALSLLRD
ncbi:unnamed protein product, partial [Phaeothamnion confervicola]